MATLCNFGWITSFVFSLPLPPLPIPALPPIPTISFTLPTVYCPLD